MRVRILLAPLPLLALCAPTLADDLRIEEFAEAVRVDDLNVDYAVPESPAFIALGLDPEIVTRPASPRALAASLLGAFDEYGNLQTGAAIDTAPFVLFRDVDYSLADYREAGRFGRFLARTQLSLAATRGVESDDQAVRVAAGLRANPWTTADPRTDDKLMRCLLGLAPTGNLEGASAIPEFGPDATLDDFDATLDEAEREAARRTTRCLESAERRLDGASGWDLGIAPVWIQEDRDEDVEWGGATFWSSLSLRRWDFRSDAVRERSEPRHQPQLILHTRLRLDEVVATDDDPSGFVEQNHWLAGVRLRSGVIDLGARALVLSVGCAWTLLDPRGHGSESSLRAALGADLRIAEQLWLHASLGGTSGRDDDRITLGATLAWGGQALDLAQILGAVGAVSGPGSE